MSLKTVFGGLLLHIFFANSLFLYSAAPARADCSISPLELSEDCKEFVEIVGMNGVCANDSLYREHYLNFSHSKQLKNGAESALEGNIADKSYEGHYLSSLFAICRANAAKAAFINNGKQLDRFDKSKIKSLSEARRSDLSSPCREVPLTSQDATAIVIDGLNDIICSAYNKTLVIQEMKADPFYEADARSLNRILPLEHVSNLSAQVSIAKYYYSGGQYPSDDRLEKARKWYALIAKYQGCRSNLTAIKEAREIIDKIDGKPQWEKERVKKQENSRRKKKDVGDFVCSLEDRWKGYVEKVYKDRVQVRVHVVNTSYIGDGNSVKTESDQMIWVKYDQILLCDDIE